MHRERARDRDALLLAARQVRRILLLDARREADLLEIRAGAILGFLLRDAEHVDGCFHHVLDHVHVRPEIEVLEHHRQLGAYALQLLRIGRAQRARLVGGGAHFLAVDDDAARVRLFEEVDTAQHRALAGTGRADHADHVARVRLQRHALEHLVVAVPLVQIVDEKLLSLGIHIVLRKLTCLAGADTRASDARPGGTATRARTRSRDRAARRCRMRGTTCRSPSSRRGRFSGCPARSR
ncbi:hypothetical protein BamMEX5DRAFT_6674 [Burkholderia ambifaria MEX-5]|uniref:Uncharacterized protein n=1 Tax=Burkholderia ambifaria MEX-5 TaxID=396597 RepID=B1TFV8_9BURK|nr:hypothetical protein BamMEX5DRAFT_6674 [Burkholderia ambifaria MEX-5]